jgi:hypothetical protein
MVCLDYTLSTGNAQEGDYPDATAEIIVHNPGAVKSRCLPPS